MNTQDVGKRYRSVLDTRSRLGQVMTPAPLADAVVKLMGVNGGQWLELGSGSGHLANAVHSNASPESYLGVEIESAMMKLSPEWPGFSYLQADVLAAGALSAALNQRDFDYVIGNPPYGIHRFPAEAEARLRHLCPELDVQGNWAPIDLYFVLESLSILKQTGSAAFIVGPDIPCGLGTQHFRKMLVESASEIECYELPPGAFKRPVEVQAYVIVVRYGQKPAQHVSLGRLDDQFEIATVRRFSCEQAMQTMNLSAHEFKEINDALMRSCEGLTMRDLDVSIVRGSRTRFQFAEMGVQHFHTSDFPRSGMEISLESAAATMYQEATVGDILLPRVGTRCLEHKAIVVSGQSPYSDAVFRVRAPTRHYEQVVRWITSVECANWRRMAARGACAKHLTVSSLMGMPVPA